MITPVPYFYVNFNQSKISRAGTKNAKVFPEPVRAAPTKSLPLRI